jgi:hypothetical protein
MKASSYLMTLLDHITNVYFSNIPWYSLFMWVFEHEKPLDDICNDSNTYEFFNIVNTSTYIIHNFHVNYQNRPHELENISPYEFAYKYFKVNCTLYYQLLEHHPQKHTHSSQVQYSWHSNFTRV